MALSDKDKIILEEIVSLNGNCLDGARCHSCPFRTSCLPEFLITPKEPPTKNQRLQMALDVITYNILLGDSEGEKDRWLKK